jgi:hypothetical protein
MQNQPQEPRKGESLAITPGSPIWLQLVSQIEHRVGHRICGAKTRKGVPCPTRPVRKPDGSTNGRCRMHGGTSLAGMQSPTYVHGRNSRFNLTGRLAGPYQDALADMDYISLQKDLAFNGALIEEAANDLDQHQIPESLDPRTFDPEECKARELEIVAALEHRAGLEARYRRLTLDRNKLTRTETARVKLAEDTVSGQQVRLFGQAVLDSLRRHLMDFAQTHGIGVPDALRLLGEVQTEVVSHIRMSRRAPGAHGISDNGELLRGET